MGAEVTDPNPTPTWSGLRLNTLLKEEWSQATGTLRLGHWVKVTIYRFGDWRELAKTPLGKHAAALPLSGSVAEGLADEHSSRRFGLHKFQPTQVYTMTAHDELVDPGVGGHPGLIGTVTRAARALRQRPGGFRLAPKSSASGYRAQPPSQRRTAMLRLEATIRFTSTSTVATGLRS